MPRLSDLTVLVTGASSDVGTAVVGRLVGEGVTVIAGSRSPDSHPLEGARVASVVLDVTKAEAWSRLADRLRSEGVELVGR